MSNTTLMFIHYVAQIIHRVKFIFYIEFVFKFRVMLA